jgi:ABC-type siderophore export system fused ATPase/permease subunit
VGGREKIRFHKLLFLLTYVIGKVPEPNSHSMIALSVVSYMLFLMLEVVLVVVVLVVIVAVVIVVVVAVVYQTSYLLVLKCHFTLSLRKETDLISKRAVSFFEYNTIDKVRGIHMYLNAYMCN